jgi:hypothetical protein
MDPKDKSHWRVHSYLKKAPLQSVWIPWKKISDIFDGKTPDCNDLHLCQIDWDRYAGDAANAAHVPFTTANQGSLSHSYMVEKPFYQVWDAYKKYRDSLVSKAIPDPDAQ